MSAQLELPLVLERRDARAPGLVRWLEQWRGRQDVRVLIAAGQHELVVVSATLELARDERSGFYRLPR